MALQQKEGTKSDKKGRMAELFQAEDVRRLLKNKFIVFLGDSSEFRTDES